MKFAIFALFLGAPFLASADQAATISCTGTKVALFEKSPYLGEKSRFTQTLFTLLPKGGDESSDTAYFLRIEHDITGVQHGGAGRIMISGRNEKRGDFELIIDQWKDVGNGTVIKQESKGTISYSHGPTLQGKDEPVTCTRE